MAKRTPRTKRAPRAAEQRDMDGRAEGSVALDMTGPLAAIFAKLLSVGCPPVRAVLFISPKLDIETAKVQARQWCNDSLVLRAVELVNGGEWMDMPKEQRMALALDKQLAEMAFYVWSNNWAEAVAKEDIEKMRVARDVMTAALGRKIDTDDPMQAFARLALALTKNMAEADVKKKRPPQVTPDPPDVLGQIVAMVPARDS